MATNKKKPSEKLTEAIKHLLLTYGLGRMDKPVQLLRKWLDDPPDEVVTIISHDFLAREQARLILKSAGIKCQERKSTRSSKYTTAYRLIIPALVERIEDIPLITEYHITDHLRIHDRKPPNLTNLHLMAFYFLCMKHDISVMRNPILTYDDYVAYLKDSLDFQVFDLSPKDMVEFEKLEDPPLNLKRVAVSRSQIDEFWNTQDEILEWWSHNSKKSPLLDPPKELTEQRNRATLKRTLSPFALLSDESIQVNAVAVTPPNRYCWEDNEIQAAAIAPADDSGGTTTDQKVVVSGEFRHWLLAIVGREGGKQFRDQTVKTENIEKAMVKIGRKSCLLQGSGKLTVANGINDRRVESLDAISSKAALKEEPVQLLIMGNERSVVYKNMTFMLPDKHFDAIAFIAKSHQQGSPWVRKTAIYDRCDVKDGIRPKSVRKWFLDNGGAARKLAKAGLIETNLEMNATCRIPIDPDQIDVRDPDWTEK